MTMPPLQAVMSSEVRNVQQGRCLPVEDLHEKPPAGLHHRVVIVSADGFFLRWLDMAEHRQAGHHLCTGVLDHFPSQSLVDHSHQDLGHTNWMVHFCLGRPSVEVPEETDTVVNQALVLMALEKDSCCNDAGSVEGRPPGMVQLT